MVHILSKNASKLQVVGTLEWGANSISADQQSIYVTSAGDWGSGIAYVQQISHNGTQMARYEEEGKFFISPVLAPDGYLFYVCIDMTENHSEIVAFDTVSLQVRYRFGRTRLRIAQGMVLVGNELFVCDLGNNSIQVFSVAGEFRRSIMGEWERPHLLCFAQDRLYLVERASRHTEHNQQGNRILVMSLQGALLQVYAHPEALHFKSLCSFDGRLLASYTFPTESPSEMPVDGVVGGLMALSGL